MRLLSCIPSDRSGPDAASCAAVRRKRQDGLTLVELLAVMAIIALIAGLALPAMRRRGDAAETGAQQLLADLGTARLRAISGRTSVYVLFSPPLDRAIGTAISPTASFRFGRGKSLANGQYTSYAMFVRRSVGAQPGRAEPRYLTEWRSLPEGCFFAEAKFYNGTTNYAPFPYISNIPVPNASGVFRDDYMTNMPMPYVEFNHLGQCIGPNGQPTEVIIPLARGSVLILRDNNGRVDWRRAEAAENPAGNSADNPFLLVIDPLSGRARIDRKEITS